MEDRVKAMAMQTPKSKRYVALYVFALHSDWEFVARRSNAEVLETSDVELEMRKTSAS